MKALLRRKGDPTAAMDALNEMVSQGVIKGFEMNLESRKRAEPAHVLIHADDGDYLWRERLWLRVCQALEPLGERVTVEVVYHSPAKGLG